MDARRMADLERRLATDPASVVFAQLAEAYRQAGRADEAVATCRAGLEQHPDFIAARVTLGRALLDLGRAEDAAGELAQVLVVAPDNLAAVHGMADAERARDHQPAALAHYRHALRLAPYDANIAAAVRALTPRPPSADVDAADAIVRDLAAAADSVPPVRPAPVDFDAVLASLGWRDDERAKDGVGAWLSGKPGVAPNVPPAAPLLPDTSLSSAAAKDGARAADDPFALLEAHLRRAAATDDADATDVADGIRTRRAPVAARDRLRVRLDRWLLAIARRRRDAGAC